MAFRDEDSAVGRDKDIGRFVEESGVGASHAGLAKGPQNLSLGAELEDLASFSVLRLLVRDPEVAVRVHGCAVGKHKHPFAPALEKLSGFVEFQDRRLGASRTGVSRTSMDDIDAAVFGHFDCSYRSPRRAARWFSPVAY